MFECGENGLPVHNKSRVNVENPTIDNGEMLMRRKGAGNVAKTECLCIKIPFV